MAELLSQKINEDELVLKPKSVRRYLNHTSSLVTAAIARYSASVEDFETMVCFLDFHEIKESPKKTQKPVTERLVSIHPAQSESLKALSCMDDFVEKNKP